MTEDLDREVHLLESTFFMSYPYDVYARLRREAPVYLSERDNIWAITKYEDVRAISRTPRLFANGYHVVSFAAATSGDPNAPEDPSGLPSATVARRQQILDPDGNDSLTFSDGERHAFLRKIASSAFTPRAVAKLEDEVERLTADMFRRIEPDVEVDFIDAVAAPVPVLMIARLLGVGDDHAVDFRRWSDAFSELGDEVDGVLGGGDPELLAQRIEATQEFNAFFREEFEDRRKNPRDDLLTSMVMAKWQDREMTMSELLAMTTTLLIAGNETTRALISGAGKLLAENPDQRTILQETPDLVVPAVEEFIRLTSPVTHMCRTVLEDTEIRGIAIPKGAYLCMIYPAANRDEDIWERSEELDVTRSPDPSHVAFGFAEHFCLGASLARREARIVLTHLLDRFSDWHLVGDIRRAQNHMTPGITHMPVVFRR